MEQALALQVPVFTYLEEDMKKLIRQWELVWDYETNRIKEEELWERYRAKRWMSTILCITQ